VVEQFKYILKTYFSLFFSVVLCDEQCLKIKFEGGGGEEECSEGAWCAVFAF
jgi:hypothetical protein